ncbi:MAG: glycosyltransferase family 2 protein, partial [Paracoccaceae bacterium]|nr:glycosyltransferase family 2 protein [Paracoccaceae bacterium]
ASSFDMGYWVERNFSDVEDCSIAALAAQSAPLLAELRADPVLGPRHDQAVSWRKARFTALMAEEPWRALFGRLLMTPASRPLPADQARLIWAHTRPAGRKP